MTEGWGSNANTPPIGHNSGEGWGNTTQVNVEVAPQQTYPVVYPGQPETEEPEAYRLRRNAELENWLNNLAAYKAQQEIEREWRKKVTTTLFPTPKKGTQRYDMGGGYKVKLVQNYTYTIGDKDLQDEDTGDKIPIREQVEKIEQQITAEHGEAGYQVFKRLVEWEPKFSGSNYEKLDRSSQLEMAVKELLRPLVTIKASTPQLEFEEPKES